MKPLGRRPSHQAAVMWCLPRESALRPQIYLNSLDLAERDFTSSTWITHTHHRVTYRTDRHGKLRMYNGHHFRLEIPGLSVPPTRKHSCGIWKCPPLRLPSSIHSMRTPEQSQTSTSQRIIQTCLQRAPWTALFIVGICGGLLGRL